MDKDAFAGGPANSRKRRHIRSYWATVAPEREDRINESAGSAPPDATRGCAPAPCPPARPPPPRPGPAAPPAEPAPRWAATTSCSATGAGSEPGRAGRPPARARGRGGPPAAPGRSEERRVGKEGRARGS